MLIAGIIAAVVVVSLLSGCVYLWLKIYPDRGDVPRLTTPAWEFSDLKEGEQLMLRRETEAGGALLLKRTDLETVYRYDPQSRRVKAVSAGEWKTAGGAIARCSTQEWATASVLRRDDKNHRLFAGEREVPTAGGFPLVELNSPSGKWVAVYSGAGPAVSSIIPLSPDLILGQRYHEIMSLPDVVRVGKPVRIPVEHYYDYLQPCWSADDKFVVYTSSGLPILIVVETGL
jgi:hypothetical protein